MPLDTLYEASDRLTRGLQLMMPGASIESKLIGLDPQ